MHWWSVDQSCSNYYHDVFHSFCHSAFSVHFVPIPAWFLLKVVAVETAKTVALATFSYLFCVESSLAFTFGVFSWEVSVCILAATALLLLIVCHCCRLLPLLPLPLLPLLCEFWAASANLAREVTVAVSSVGWFGWINIQHRVMKLPWELSEKKIVGHSEFLEEQIGQQRCKRRAYIIHS